MLKIKIFTRAAVFLSFLFLGLISCRGQGPDSNPYLKKSIKNKPSSELAGGNKSHIRKLNREYIKEMKRNKRKLGIK